MGGTFTVVNRSPTVLRSKCSGRFDDALCAQVIATVDDWRGTRTGLTAFSDVSEIDDYDVTARAGISEWLRRLMGAFETVHILVKGRTIAWAIKIVGIVSGANIVAYHSLDAFEEAYQDFLKGKR